MLQPVLANRRIRAGVSVITVLHNDTSGFIQRQCAHALAGERIFSYAKSVGNVNCKAGFLLFQSLTIEILFSLVILKLN